MTTKRKIVIGVAILIGIAAAFLLILLTTIAAIAVWIFLVWNIRKKGTGLFHENIKPELVAKRYRILKILLTVAAISAVAGITGAVMHNVLYSVTEQEDAVSFFIALSTLWLFILLTGGSLLIYLTGQRNPAQ